MSQPDEFFDSLNEAPEPRPDELLPVTGLGSDLLRAWLVRAERTLCAPRPTKALEMVGLDSEGSS